MKFLTKKLLFIVCLLMFFAVQQVSAQEVKSDTTKKVEKKLKKEKKETVKTESKKLKEFQKKQEQRKRKKRIWIHLNKKKQIRSKK
jgi:hypothetical protein